MPTTSPLDKKIARFGEEAVYQWFEDAKPLTHLAKELKCSHGDLYKWMAAGEIGPDGKTERQRRWIAAKRVRAITMLEDAQQLLETAKPQTSAEANLIKTRVAHLQFMASKLSPDEFGDRPPQQNINLDIGSLHLDALRQYGKLTPSDWEEPVPLPKEAVLISEGEE